MEWTAKIHAFIQDLFEEDEDDVLTEEDFVDLGSIAWGLLRILDLAFLVDLLCSS